MTDARPRMRAEAVTAHRARDLRRTMSLPERILWSCLRGRRLHGLHFRRQHPMLDYILDFYCPDRRLAVEVDGAGHALPDQIARDRRRDARLAEIGVLTLRLPTSGILHDDGLQGVLQLIAHTALTRAPLAGSAGLSPPARGRRA